MTKKSFHLRWNNHLQNLQSLFENLFNEQTLVDVTLSCSDGLLYGHKLVLSACSPYFEQVFKDNPCRHPIMILKGISRRDMQVLLEYMYIGSVDVGEEDLEMLLDIATELQIKGLVHCPEETLHPVYQSTKLDRPHHSSKDCQNTVLTTSSVSQPMEDLRWQAELVPKHSGLKYKESDSISKQVNSTSKYNLAEEVSQNNTQIRPHHQDNEIDFEPIYPKKEINEETMKEEYQETSEEESKDYTPENPLEDSSSSTQINYNFQEHRSSDADDINYFCHMCTRSFQNKGSYHRHMMTHAGVKPHHCTFCNQSFLRQSHLQRHIRVHTGERPYSCGQCPKQFARSDKLRQHYIIQHNGTNVNKKPRGRPRKNLGVFLPSTSSTSVEAVNSNFPVIVNTVSLNAV